MLLIHSFNHKLLIINCLEIEGQVFGIFLFKIKKLKIHLYFFEQFYIESFQAYFGLTGFNFANLYHSIFSLSSENLFKRLIYKSFAKKLSRLSESEDYQA